MKWHRRSSCRRVAVALGLGIAAIASVPVPGLAEALNALVARESGVLLGRCDLFPAPALEGTVHAVMPARF